MNEINISLTIPVLKSVAGTGVPEDATLILDQTPGYGKTYSGSAERCTCHWATLSSDVGAIDDWIAKKALSNFDDGIAAKGGKLLHVQLYKTKQWDYFLGFIPYPVVSYYAVAEADVSGEAAAAGLALRSPFPWAIVIAAVVIGLVAYFLIKPIIDSVNTFMYGPGQGGVGVGWLLIIVLVLYLLSGSGKKEKAQGP